MLKRRHLILFYFNMFKWTFFRSKETNQLNIFQIKKSSLSNTFHVLRINDWSIDSIHQPCNSWINLEFLIWHDDWTSKGLYQKPNENQFFWVKTLNWFWRNHLKFILWIEKLIERTGIFVFVFVFDNLNRNDFSCNEHIN